MHNHVDTSMFSLADFYVGDSDDPFVPSGDFVRWRRQAQWAASLYERNLLAGPVPRTRDAGRR